MTPRRTALVAAALVTPALLAAMLVAPTAATAAGDPALELVGRYQIPGGAEVSAYMDGKLYVINGPGIDIVPVDPMSTTLTRSGDPIVLSPAGVAVTSVAAKEGLVAAAVPSVDKTKPGTVVIMDAAGRILATVLVGALPDMLTFDDKGQMLVVANEGEPSGYGPGYSDPEGSVTVIYVDRLLKSQGKSVATIGFTDFNDGGPRHAELSADVRVFGPGATVAQDLEPEYVTIDGNRGYVTLQENNAIAELDLRSGRVIAIRALGLKDHNVAGNGLDASDREVSSSLGAINIAPWPVLGMYMPDGIASYQVRGKTYLLTANEGDARDYPGLKEEASVKNLTLDPTVFPNAVALKTDPQLGRLTVTTVGASTDSDGDADRLLAFGARSLTVWTADGTRVWDSGDRLEQVTATALPANFNSTNDANNFDNRSDNKGPEPEGVTVGDIDGRIYAFVGLERVGGMAVFDVTNPSSPVFVEYVTSRDFLKDPKGPLTDSGPEVLSFVPAGESVTGRALVIMNNEISGSVTIWSPKL